MPPRNPVNALEQAPFDELLTILLRQFKCLLAARGVDLSDAELTTLAQSVAARRDLSPDRAEKAAAIRAALVEIVQESEQVLARWTLTFNDSLATGMDAVPGWETTAEFLEIANEKSNAEIRIAAGSGLLGALGDLRYADYLLHLAAGDYDADTAIARQVLAFVSDTDRTQPGWLDQVRAWLKNRA